jgi:hypothetical protein
MMAEVENLVLDHLPHMRGQLDRMENDIGEIKGRLGRLEAGLAQVHVALAEQITSSRSPRRAGHPHRKAA